ncbi:hypothetical protein [Marinomonas ushuaiensis]|nr:hypothetical protein [Marinomonas ushuaiensis]
MRKVITVLGGVLISTSLFAVGSGWFSSIFSSEKEDILTFIPADTAYYVGGDSLDNIAQLMNDSSLINVSPRLADQLKGSLASIDDSDSPEARFFSYLMTQYESSNKSGLADVAKSVGISLTGSYALFSDGIMPVMRIEIANEDAFNVLIENAVKDSDWHYSWEEFGETKVRLWSLEEGVSLAVLNNANGVVITIVTEKDTLEAKQQRLGLIKPEASLATSEEVENLKKQYGYTGDMIGFIQIDRIIQAFVAPTESHLGHDLLTYLPQRQFNRFQSKMSEQCRSEYREISATLPRFVTGYQVLEIGKDLTSYRTRVHSILEIENEAVTLSLQNAQGHLPLHSTIATDKLAAFGVGVNASNLTSEVMSLLDQFVSAEYECDVLQYLQADIQDVDPYVLATTTPFAQGVKGVGISLFDLKMEEGSRLPASVDFLISITAENPKTFVQMAQNFPFIPQTKLPEDGSLVTLDLPPDVPVEVNAAIKGQHVVIFSGKKSTASANDMVTEPITNNSLVGMAFNFHKLGELLSSDNLNTLASSLPFDDACSMQYELSHMFQSLNTENGLLLRAGSEGLTTIHSSYLDKTKTKDLNLVGEYNVAFLNDDCEWQGKSEEESTEDHIREDGTGLYVVKGDADMCDLYVSNYSWKQNGNVLVINSQDQDRDSCETELSKTEQETYSCYLVDEKDAEFQCVYSFDGYLSVEKYTRAKD